MKIDELVFLSVVLREAQAGTATQRDLARAHQFVRNEVALETVAQLALEANTDGPFLLRRQAG